MPRAKVGPCAALSHPHRKSWSACRLKPMPVGIIRPGYRRRWGSAGPDIDAGGDQPARTSTPVGIIRPDLRILSLDRRVRENALALGFEILPAESLIGGSQA